MSGKYSPDEGETRRLVDKLETEVIRRLGLARRG
jgi:hypothetical protein